MTRHQINNRGTGTARIAQTSTRHVLSSRSSPRIIIGEQGSSPVTPPPSLVSSPVVTGIVRIGEVLTSTTGVWADASSYAFQWTRDGNPIVGETSLTYVVTASDIASLIACIVTATGPGGVSVPEASNVVESVWRAILVLKPSALIWDGNDAYCYGGASIGSPVSEMRSVNGILIGEQPVTPNMATRTALNQLDFDDLDDYYDCPSPVVAYMHQDTSICIHASGLSSSMGQVLYYALLSSPTVRFGRVAASASSSRNDHRTNATQTVMLGPASAVQDIVVRYAAAPDMAIFELSSGVTLHTSVAGTRSTGTGGTLRIGADPPLSQTFGGAIRCLVFDNSAWDTTTMAVYRTCAIAAGVM